MFRTVSLSIVGALLCTLTSVKGWNYTDSDDCDCSLSCQNTTAYEKCTGAVYTCLLNDDDYHPNMTDDEENDILFPCINEVVNNGSYDCSCYLDTLQCYIDDCSDWDDNCSYPCYQDHFIDCLVDADGCWTAWTAFSNQFFEDDSNVTVVTPKIVDTWVNETYCDDPDTKDYCSAQFWEMWNCYRECIWDDCPWINCEDEIEACAANATCYKELEYAMSMEETYDQDNAMEEYLISYYCLFETENGECTDLFNAAWYCYDSNCGENSTDCMSKYCDDYIDACFQDEECGALIRQNFYIENICDDESDYYNEEDCRSLNLDGNYSIIQNLCFFDDYECNDVFLDAFSCYLNNCNNDTDDSECNIWDDCRDATLACYFDYDCYTAFYVNIDSWILYLYLDINNFLVNWPSEYNDSVATWCKEEYDGVCSGLFFDQFECWFDECFRDDEDESCAEKYCEEEVSNCLDDRSCYRDLQWAVNEDECDLEDLKYEYCISNDTRCGDTFDTMWECVVEEHDCLECEINCNIDCDTGEFNDACTETDEHVECYTYINNCYQRNGYDNTTSFWESIACFEEAFDNSTLNCSCYEKYFECNFQECDSDGNDTDCFDGCLTDNFVDCIFEETCRIPLLTLFNQSWFQDDNDELFTPTDITEWVEDYCGGLDSFDTCSSEFYTIFSCFEGCWSDECVWGNCIDYIDKCINDTSSDCYAEITWMFNMDDTFGDISDYMGGLVGGYYCEYMVDGGCSTELQDAIDCYQDNCEDDRECIGENCGDALEACFADEDCGNVAISALAYSHLCENDEDENEWFNVTECEKYNQYDDYDWIQEMCFFGDFNCNDLVSDVIACNLKECEEADEHDDWEENDNGDCNIVWQCTNQVVACWLDYDCYTAFWVNWDSLSSAIVSDIVAFNTPAQYNATIKEWCDTTDGITCNSNFWSVWNCFSDSCVYSSCVWDYCTDLIEECAKNDTCGTDMAYISEIHEDYDTDAAIIDAKEDYCSGSTGTCSATFEAAWDCYETNCLNSSSGTGDNETSACESDVTGDCVYYDGSIKVTADAGVNIFNWDYNDVLDIACDGYASICIITQIEDDDSNGDSVTLTVGIGIEDKTAYEAISGAVAAWGTAIIDAIDSKYGETVTVELNPTDWNTDNAADCGITDITSTNDAVVYGSAMIAWLFGVVMVLFS